MAKGVIVDHSQDAEGADGIENGSDLLLMFHCTQNAGFSALIIAEVHLEN